MTAGDDHGDAALPGSVLLGYSLINFVIQSIIQPRFVGKAVGLSTTVTLLAVVFWGWVLGTVGALLAIPLTLLAKGLLIDSDPATRWIGLFISSNPSPSPPVPHTASRQPGPPPSGQAPDPDVVPAPGPVREPGPVPVGPRPGDAQLAVPEALPCGDDAPGHGRVETGAACGRTLLRGGTVSR